MTDRILYMEDDPAQARLGQRCLERAGYSVDVAVDGPAGLARHAAGEYAAVVVDQSMPGLCGLEVIRVMAERGPLPPTIMVTGTGDEQIAVQAMKAGACDYLVKDAAGGFIKMLPLVVRRAIEQRRTLLEKRQMEQELAQARKMRSIGQLAAGIAHEINTPNQYLADNARFLQGAFSDISKLLDAYDELLQAARRDDISDSLVEQIENRVRQANLGYLTAEIPQAIEQSLEGVAHVASIVGAMREYAHPNSGQKQAVDLNHAIESALTLCRNEWKYVAKVVTDFDPSLPPVHCQPSDINRVVMNLVVNAAHATAQATHNGADGKRDIVVRTRRDGDWAEIRVEDSGTGIAEEHRAHVFDLFFTTKDVGQGTGQGLAIAQAIVVEKHGGTIRFETEPGQGTTFVVRLPIGGRVDRPAEAVAEEEEAELVAVL